MSQGSVSPLEAVAEQILDLIAQQPNLTLVETVTELRKRRIRTSCSSLWRFLDRHEITLKKSLQAAERQRADVARARRRWIREQGMLDSTRLVFIDETAVSTNLARVRGRAPRGARVIGTVPLGSWKTITFVAAWASPSTSENPSSFNVPAINVASFAGLSSLATFS
jgi:hypothetical protein